ncbi:hypothetical protein QAD02_022856 [Eretmocerus hayati]|uniref:Uncharacterized protein n=1 Tax=Eretmocerus hayati TaxID=131215 RepID=A0ACC2PUJ6_9HYME|nr:hypothetical protein QAD02_022856 [Eretmocerus hayati]
MESITFKIYLENRITLLENIFKCYLCHFEVSQEDHKLLQKHLSDSPHQTRLSQIDEKVRASQSKLLSTISGQKHGELMRNCVILERQPCSFRCHACKCSVSGLPNILEHIRGLRHSNSIKASIHQQANERVLEKEKLETNNTNSSSHSKSLSRVPDCITCNSNNVYECQICHCTVGSLQNAHQHVQGYNHKKTINITHSQKSKQTKVVKNISYDATIEESTHSLISNISYCKLCKETLRSHSALQCHALQHLYLEVDFLLPPDILIFTQNVNAEQIVQCSLCQITLLNYANVGKHFRSKEHKDRLAHFTHLRSDLTENDFCSSSIKDIMLKGFKFEPSKHIIINSICDACNVLMPPSSEREHVTGKKHAMNLLKNVNPSSIHPQNGKKPYFDLKNTYPCFVCNASFADVVELLDHYNSYVHRCRITNLYKIQQSPFVNFTKVHNKTVLNCSLCCANKMLSLRVAVDHILGKKHRNSLELVAATHTAKLSQDFHAIHSQKIEIFENISDGDQLKANNSADKVTQRK